MSGQPVPSQLDQVLPQFYVQKAGPYHPFGRIRIAPFGKGGLRILAESGYTLFLPNWPNWTISRPRHPAWSALLPYIFYGSNLDDTKWRG